MKICESDVRRVQGTFEIDAKAGPIGNVVVIDGVRYPYYGILKPNDGDTFSGGMLLKDIGGYARDHVFDDANISKCTPEDLRRRDSDLFKERMVGALMMVCLIVSFVIVTIIFSKFTLGKFSWTLAYPMAIVMAFIFMWIASFSLLLLELMINEF